MQFSLRTLLELTCFVAALAAISTRVDYGFIGCFFVVHVGAFVPALAMAFWAILTAKQVGSQLEWKYEGLPAFLLRFSSYCFVTIAAFWSFLILGGIYQILWGPRY